ncbi:hypothetical protein FIBSPDRAFT_1051722 [Athelia psychrophila]|uniref:NADP-dependent oxidoreductase domain-containing protein n=1 Tax=Athelia psychrophila TaxID=1759441 RepID=A0A165YM43_9AGAM|nr:hypothetical protein FIBSPDRAFT_1051722 [Fibularhizoctonia sp. CBS 109695]
MPGNERAQIKRGQQEVTNLQMQCARKLTQGKETHADMQRNPCSSQAHTPLDPDELCLRRTSSKKEHSAHRRVQEQKAELQRVVTKRAKFLEGILPAKITPTVNQVCTEIAKKYRLQISDVLLGYILAQDVVVPKLVTPARIASNYIGTVAAVKRLTEEDLQTLDMAVVGGK